MKNQNKSKNTENDIDYLHPEGDAPKRKPKNKKEAENEKQAKESTELANALKVEKGTKTA